MSKTAEEFINSIKKRLAYENPNLDLTSGNVVTDLGVEAFAEELAALSTEEDRIRLMYLFNDEAFTETEADLLANSFGIQRLEATKATGSVIFGSQTAPIPGAHFTIPIGTTVTTDNSDGNVKSFVTTTEGYITSDTPLNQSTNYYEVIVGVEATIAGSSSNVGPGALNTIKGSVNGISVVYNNDAITNGTDKESKESLLARVKRNLVGYIYGTKASLLNRVLSYSKVSDAMIVDPNNEFSVRGPGSIDIYILGNILGQFEQQISDKKQESYLEKTPVINPHSARVVFNDGTAIEEGSGFSIVKDNYTMYAGSYKSRDKIVWTDTAYTNYVKTKTYYTVTYQYNQLISDIQEEFEKEDTHVLTSDVLIRDTERLDVKMSFDIVTLAGYDQAAVMSNVINAIQTYVNSFTLNQTLRQSDIIGLVEGVQGVDYLKLPMRTFCLVEDNTVEDVPSSPLEYIRISRDNIQIG